MDMLKKIWPTPFKIVAKDTTAMVVQIIVYVIVSAVSGIVISLFSWFPFVGILFSALGSLISLYCIIAIVLCILKYFDIFN